MILALSRLAALALLTLLAAPAVAMAPQPGDQSGLPPWANEALAKAKQQIDAGRYAVALGELEAVLDADPENPDVLTYIAYAHRKRGELDAAQESYEKALALDPQHRGANAYLGDLYLARGDLASAKARLEVLDGACLFGCAEYDALKESIEAFEAGRFDPGAK